MTERLQGGGLLVMYSLMGEAQVFVNLFIVCLFYALI